MLILGRNLQLVDDKPLEYIVKLSGRFAHVAAIGVGERPVRRPQAMLPMNVPLQAIGKPCALGMISEEAAGHGAAPAGC